MSVRKPTRARRGSSLTELIVSAGLWAAVVTAIATALAGGTRGLAESQVAADLCVAAAGLDAAIHAAARVRAPGAGWTARELLLAREDGARLRYRVEGHRLVERNERSSRTRILAGGIDHVLFFTRGTKPPIVRYFVSSRDRCILSSEQLGAPR